MVLAWLMLTTWRLLPLASLGRMSHVSRSRCYTPHLIGPGVYKLLTFSFSTCDVMFIPVSPRATSATPNNLTLDGRTLATIDHVIILGVVICSDLSESRQLHTVCGKISDRLAVFRRLGSCINTTHVVKSSTALQNHA